jgi:hypothetical protein|tara:strand:- start:5 stop:298 length:294 start_codon:yes stop_codon:yes gene_type:complete
MREQLTFKVEFVSELDEKNNRDFIFRQMKMKDVRKWSALQREDYKGDKMEDVVSLLRETVVNVKQKEFTSWLDNLYEDEFVSFLETFTEAKEEERKK